MAIASRIAGAFRLTANRPSGLVPEWSPYEVWLLFSGVLSGLGMLLFQTFPDTISMTLPLGARLTWAITLGVGSFVGLLGLFWKGDPLFGIEIERIGLACLALGTFVYTGAVLDQLGTVALYPAISVFSIGVATLGRIYQLTTRLSRARKILLLAPHMLDFMTAARTVSEQERK